MRRVYLTLAFAVTLAIGQALVSVSPSQALEPLEGYFIAQKTCPAYLSKNRQTNPGGVETRPMTAYGMIGLNKVGGDYYQLVVPTAPESEERWVHASCGVHVVEAGTGTQDDLGGEITGEDGNTGERSAEGKATDNVLALSWQPAFCETKPDKKECQALNRGDLPSAATGLSIHGLWPQDAQYCAISPEGKKANLKEAFKAELAVLMPGVITDFQDYEWNKHGTCYGAPGGAEEYFRDTMRLTRAINASAVGALFLDNMGQRISSQEIRESFDRAFGEGAGKRVKIKCVKDGTRDLVVELQINLFGEITEEADLGSLLLAARPARGGCGGEVDVPGLQ